MSDAEFKNASVQTRINAIKEKHFSEVDAQDMAFLKAREDMLSDADKQIYLEGKNPNEVLVESTPLTREERIINENRPLQEAERAVRAARNATLGAGEHVEANHLAVENAQEAREAKFKALTEEVAALEKSQQEEEKARAKAAKEDEKASEKDSKDTAGKKK